MKLTSGAARWQSLPELLVDSAARRSDSVAMVSPTETTSYGELFSDALSLADRLAPARGQLVAVALPKSRDLVVAWLGCWLAGAAFSTLDPSLPRARAMGILERLRPRLLLRGAGEPAVAAAGSQSSRSAITSTHGRHPIGMKRFGAPDVSPRS
ncbi:MAG: AMP-binding protein [Polyangiaceae bacterium]